VHRIWAFLAGLPVGVLGAFAAGTPSWSSLELSLPLCGAAWLAAVELAGRLASPEPERGAQLARAASVGAAALPAAAATWIGLLPGAPAALACVAFAFALRLAWATRASGPAGGWARPLGAAAAWLAAGAALSLAAAGLLAAASGSAPRGERAEALAAFVYGVDAGVPLGPDPRCEAAVASEQVLGVGAAPAVSDEALWFEAPGPDGRRQIHRLDRAGGAARCWTCEEPGNNRRPRLSSNGASIVFETDRYRGPFEPVNLELHASAARAPEPRRSRRLTFDAGPDTHGSLAPGGRSLVWSSGSGGRHAVAWAGLRSGHGGLVLGAAEALVPGRAAWVAPLAWSPDARSLVVLRGDPLGVQEAFALDPATGRERALSHPDARVVAASFSADGALLAVATTRPAAAAAALPPWLGFLVGRIAALGPAPAARARGSGVRIGPAADAALTELPLGELAGFGAPTGIALEPDGRALVLGQRRTTAAGVEERLVRIALRCP
jgi:hypothetical protein